MSDRSGRRRHERTDRATAWDGGSFAPLPKRTRARKRIHDEPGAVEFPLDPPGRRKLTPSERNRYRERYEVRHAALPPPRRIHAQQQRSRWWTKAAMFGLFAVLLGSIGAGRFLGADALPTPTATVSSESTQ